MSIPVPKDAALTKILSLAEGCRTTPVASLPRLGPTAPRGTCAGAKDDEGAKDAAGGLSREDKLAMIEQDAPELSTLLSDRV